MINNNSSRKEIQKYLESEGFAVYENESFDELLNAALEHQKMCQEHESYAEDMFKE